MFSILETCWILMLIVSWRLLSHQFQHRKKSCLNPQELRVQDHQYPQFLQAKKMWAFKREIKTFLVSGINSPNRKIYLKHRMILKNQLKQVSTGHGPRSIQQKSRAHLMITGQQTIKHLPSNWKYLKTPKQMANSGLIGTLPRKLKTWLATRCNLKKCVSGSLIGMACKVVRYKKNNLRLITEKKTVLWMIQMLELC